VLTTDELTASQAVVDAIAIARRAADDLLGYCAEKKMGDNPSGMWATRQSGLRRTVGELTALERRIKTLFA
jgi:hypothetical protein